MADPNTRSKSREDRYQALFESSADAILIIVGDKFVDCNQAAVEMLRAKDKETVLQTHPSELSPEFQPDGRRSFEKANEYMATAMEKGTLRFEWDHLRADGELFPVEVLLTAIPSDDGYELHTVWRDITERKKLENELRHAQKMEAIGKLAGGIAHDFNNQLVPILGYAEMLKAALPDTPELEGYVEAIEKAGTRSAELVKRLMVFSHKDVRQKSVIDLNEATAELLEMLGQLIGEDIELVFSRADQPLPIEIGAGDMEQIVLNLATNARDAMPEGGEIRLALGRISKSGSDYACLELSDNGCGMDKTTLEQIFEPFFTTKELGSGTGLGLSTVYSLVGQAQGEISADSRPGEGTRFEVLLPLSSQPVGACARPSPCARETHRDPVTGVKGSRILVVEDDEQVAGLIRGVMVEAGFEVTDAANGLEALDLIGKQAFDLILTDVIMPGMSGPKMVKEKEALGIDTPVLFMSGYTDDRLAAQGFDSRNICLLRKPFAPSELLEQVSHSLITRC